MADDEFCFNLAAFSSTVVGISLKRLVYWCCLCFFCVVLVTSEIKTASSLVKTTSVMSASADRAAGAYLTSSGSH